MKNTREMRFRYICPGLFLVATSTLVFAFGQDSPNTRQGGQKATTRLATSPDEPEHASAKEESKGGGDDQARPNLLASFPIAKDGDLVVLPVTIEEKEYLFMLDTGTAIHIFDSSLRHLLGESVQSGEAKDRAPSVPGELYNAPTARIGELEPSKDDLVTCADLTMIRYVSGKDISGILGVPFFKHHIVQIDWDRGKLLVFKPDTVPESGWGQAVPIAFDKVGGPLVEASLGTNTPARFLIVTGANTTGSLKSDLFNRLANQSLLKITGGRGLVTLNTVVGRRTGRLAQFSVGPFEHKELIFHRDKLNKLGLPYLSRYRVTFDFPHKMLYLNKAKGYSRSDHEDMSGLHLVRVQGQTSAIR